MPSISRSSLIKNGNLPNTLLGISLSHLDEVVTGSLDILLNCIWLVMIGISCLL